MAKLIGLFHRKDGLSTTEFRDYYENHHAPFAASHFGHLFASYTRNYIDPDIGGDSGADTAGIAVVTEIVFPDDAAMQEMFAMAERDPSLRVAIATDEGAFMNREANRILLVSDAGVRVSRGSGSS
ncbi:EthD domain-containing protein [Nocardia speluncae]|uniref:EthD domain-containing protein n=1 Tax=Nocardia speluncae TaxID=419477 RepID=A0A846XCR2_9NOCA|nr:EthD domain-containing protein [Nocardia speluncae]NKY33197.1 EthD domain-containing protein [Nocardia speluncae]